MAFTVKAVVELALVVPIVLIIFISHGARAIELGSSLSATTTKENSSTQYWLSPSRIFAFGFRQQSNTTNGFDICIWMLSRPQSTVVWTARKGEAGEPYSRKATAELTRDGLLVHDNRLTRRLIAVSYDDEEYYELSSNITSGAILDSGNFVLYGETTGNVVWQSFKYPTDTLLGGQSLTTSQELGSSGSSGFRLLMRSIGEIVLYTSNDYISIEESSYWVLNTSRSGNPKLCLNASGSLYVLSQIYGNSYPAMCGRSSQYYRSCLGRPNNRLVVGVRYNSNSSTQPEAYILAGPREETSDAATFVYRATLDTYGIFRLYSHSFSSVGNSRNSSRVVTWSSLRDNCEVKGFCGLNSYCLAGEGSRCLCYPSFHFINSSDKNSGCYRSFEEERCVTDGQGEGLSIELRRRYNIYAIPNMAWSGHSYLLKGNMNKELCENSCRDDCGCWAALYMNNSECKKYRLPIMYGKRNQNLSAIALFKVLSNITDHIPTHSRNHRTYPNIDEKNGLILVLAASLGFVLCLFFFLAVSSFIVYRRRLYSYNRLLENANLGLAEEYFSLQQFSYNELESVTNGFGEELGRGSFGAVYKETTSNRDVAVKRLERVVEEGVREFRAEIMTIGQTHHRNLVQLVGFCVEGSKRLLIYEFMSNGSLSELLFKAAQRPAWKDRAKFALVLRSLQMS